MARALARDGKAAPVAAFPKASENNMKIEFYFCARFIFQGCYTYSVDWEKLGGLAAVCAGDTKVPGWQ
ncbi:MAG: hypothetical protein PHG30_07860 [Eubacteriales bacterium]|nr:hypothetical protein [Eubacteriales bacterium]